MVVIRKDFASITSLKKLWQLSNFGIQNVLRVSFSNDTYYKFKFSPELEAAINKQIQAEQQAAQEYLSLAVALLHSSVSRHGAGGFFKRMYSEELQHMQDFIKYQLHRGGVPIIQGLTAPTPKPKITLIEAFKQALAMEHCVTELIEKLVTIAEKDKDYHCVNFLTTVFLEEQLDSIHKLSQHVTKIVSIGDDPDALHQYDLHLQEAHLYKNKSTKK